MSVYDRLASDLAYLAAKIGPEAAVVEIAQTRLATLNGHTYGMVVADFAKAGAITLQRAA